jgi:hypothetical protein
MTASPQDSRFVRVGTGVVTFDGAVVEFFGFMSLESHRFHVATLEQIEIADRRLLGTAINVDVRPEYSWQAAPSFDEGQRAQLEQLIEEIHAARDAWPS